MDHEKLLLPASGKIIIFINPILLHSHFNPGKNRQSDHCNDNNNNCNNNDNEIDQSMTLEFHHDYELLNSCKLGQESHTRNNGTAILMIVTHAINKHAQQFAHNDCGVTYDKSIISTNWR